MGAPKIPERRLTYAAPSQEPAMSGAVDIEPEAACDNRRIGRAEREVDVVLCTERSTEHFPPCNQPLLMSHKSEKV